MVKDRNITININDTSPLANTAYVDSGKENKVYNKDQVNELVEDLREGTLGSISPSQTLQQLNSLPDGNYYATEAGTYAFGEVVPVGWQYRFNKSANQWKVLTKVEIPMQDLTPLYDRVIKVENDVDDFIKNFSVTTDAEFDPESNNPIANSAVSPLSEVLYSFLEGESQEDIILTMPQEGETDGSFIDPTLNSVSNPNAAWGSIEMSELSGFYSIKIKGDTTSLGNNALYLAKKIGGTWFNLKVGGNDSDFEIPIDFTANLYLYSRVKGKTLFYKTKNLIEKDSVKKYIDENFNKSDDIKLSKIGDVKMFDFNSRKLTGNIIISGDSTIAPYAGGEGVASIVKATGSITDISVPGETIAQQLGHWNDLYLEVRNLANIVFVQIGLNDLGTSSPSTSITIQALKDYFAKIRLDSPNAIIVAGEMIPCKQRFYDLWGLINGDIAFAKWKAINASLHTIAGVDRVAKVHGWLLNDGNDNLKAEFNTGDNIHENTNGRKMIAYSWLISTL